MVSTSALHMLQTQIAAVLHDVPGAVGVYLFGSRLTASDSYADLDLQVVTEDLLGARMVWPQILGAVGPIESVWPITAAADNTAYAVQFSAASYYHKVDIGLSAHDEVDRAGWFPADARWLWQQAPAPRRPALPPLHTYCPAAGSVGHALLGQLLGAVRYCKARKRGQVLTCWRFCRSAFETVLKLRLEHRRGWVASEGALSTWDYKTLDGALSGMERQALQQLLDWSTPRRMDTCLIELLGEARRWFDGKAHARQEVVPEALVDGYLRFISIELSDDAPTN